MQKAEGLVWAQYPTCARKGNPDASISIDEWPYCYVTFIFYFDDAVGWDHRSPSFIYGVEQFVEDLPKQSCWIFFFFKLFIPIRLSAQAEQTRRCAARADSGGALGIPGQRLRCSWNALNSGRFLPLETDASWLRLRRSKLQLKYLNFPSESACIGTGQPIGIDPHWL